MRCARKRSNQNVNPDIARLVNDLPVGEGKEKRLPAVVHVASDRMDAFQRSKARRGIHECLQCHSVAIGVRNDLEKATRPRR
jgi:hypothetical protein